MEKVTENCVGCTVCFEVCPVGAIHIKKDDFGFFNSVINHSICIDCGKCIKYCPQNAKLLNEKPYKSFAFQCTTNSDLLKESSSGGIFSLLGEHVLMKGGCVYGVSAEDPRNICHIRIDTVEGLKLLRGAKYVQSNLDGVFRRVKNDLDSDIMVLFSGTPCQIAGLKKFLGCSYKTLVCTEIVCHGVPSPKVFDCYLDSIERRHHSKVKTIRFRDKRAGWNNYKVAIKLDDGREIVSLGRNNNYIRGFVNNLYSMKACSACRYKLRSSMADITIGDFWGIESIVPEYRNYHKGVSIVFISTTQGKRIIDSILGDNFSHDILLDDAISYNPSIISSSPPNKYRDNFLKEVRPETFDFDIEKYIGTKPKISVKDIIKSLMYKIYGRLREYK